MPTMPITIEALELYSELDEQGAENYFRARQRKGFLEKEVIKPFEESLKARPGYTDECPPASEMLVPCKVGDIAFYIKASPSTKRPKYEEVFNYAQGLLEEALRNLELGTRMKGVLTLDGQPYISAGLVLEKMEAKAAEILKRGVKLEIDKDRTEAPEGLAEVADKLAVPIGNGLAKLEPTNAALYLRAGKLVEGYKAIINGFEGALIGLTGYSNSNPPEETQHLWQSFGSHLFHVSTVPYPSPSYGKMVSRLNKKTQKNTKTTGDLVLIERGVDRPGLEKYAVRTRDGKLYVSIRGMLDRMGEIHTEHTDIKVRQRPISHYPMV